MIEKAGGVMIINIEDTYVLKSLYTPRPAFHDSMLKKIYPVYAVVVSALVFLTLAAAAIYSNLVVIACFGLYIAFADIGLARVGGFVKRNAVPLSILVLVWVYLVYAFRSVSAEGLPLFGAYEQNFFKAVPLSFAWMFTGNELRKMILAVSGSLFLAAGLLAQIRQLHKIPFTVIILSSFLMTYLIAVVLEKPLPTERVLLPSYPILALAVCEIAALLLAKWNGNVPARLAAIGLAAAVTLLILNYAAAVNLDHTTEWKDNYPLRLAVYQSALNHEPPPDRSHWVVIFYMHQLEERYGFDYENLLKSP